MMTVSTTAIDEFRQAIEQAGLPAPVVIHDDGKLHRFPTNGKHDDDSGWYTLFSDGLPAGAFGCWRMGLKQTWCAKSENKLTDQERRDHRARIQAMQRQRDEEERQRHAEAAARARSIYMAGEIPNAHPYLVRKQVADYGLLVHHDGRLLVPLFDIDNQLHSVQFIDHDGEKLFLPGGRTKGLFHRIGDVGNTLCIAEGYATAASIHEATGLPVAAAFYADNLLPVAQALRQRYPSVKLLVCGDHDKSGIGQQKAREAAEAVGGIPVIPDTVGMDWNDVHVQRGLAAVQDAMHGAPLVADLAAIPATERPALVDVVQGGSTVSLPSVSGMSVSLSEEWPEIVPVQAELLPVEPLPLAIVPAAYRPWVSDVSNRMQCPPDFVAAGMLVMTGAIVGAGCGIRPKKHDDWTVVPNLWGGVVGRPSMLKTPAIGEAMKPLEALETKAKQEHDAAMKDHAANLEAFKALRESLQSDMRQVAKGKVTTNGHALPSMDSLKYDFAHLEEPKPPVWHRYKTNDATIEKMGELQADNPRGVLLFRDELIGLFSTWDRENHESDRAFYLESWNGTNPFTWDRIGRGTGYVPNLCVSLFGGIQPTKLSGYLHAAMRGQNNDGLVQRLQMLVYPDEPASWTLIDTPVNGSAKQDAHRAVQHLASMDFRQYGAFSEEGNSIPYFRFTEDAQNVFYDWLTDLERKLRTDDEPVVLEHLGKYRSLMPSLALLFHLLAIASAPPATISQVSRDCAEQAAAWCEYLESHARRVYGMVTNLTAQAASRLAGKIQQGALPERFTVRDVYRKGWGQLDDRTVIENACEELETLGWVREEVTPPAPGQRGKTEYVINPKVRAL